jgi:hypothetical protein
MELAPHAPGASGLVLSLQGAAGAIRGSADLAAQGSVPAQQSAGADQEPDAFTAQGVPVVPQRETGSLSGALPAVLAPSLRCWFF